MGYRINPKTGEPDLDPKTGEPIEEGSTLIDPKTGEPMTLSPLAVPKIDSAKPVSTAADAGPKVDVKISPRGLQIAKIMDEAKASGSKQALAKANRDLEKMYEDSGDKESGAYRSTMDWVERNLSGGAPEDPSLLAGAGKMIRDLWAPVGRSKIAKAAQAAVGGLASGILTPDALGEPSLDANAPKQKPSEEPSVLLGAGGTMGFSSPDVGAQEIKRGMDMVDAQQFGALDAAAQDAAENRARALIRNRVSDPFTLAPDPQTEEKANEILAGKRKSIYQKSKDFGVKLAQGVGDVVAQAYDDPGQFAADFAQQLVAPENLIGEAVTGGASAASALAGKAASQIPALAKIYKRGRLITRNTLVEAGMIEKQGTGLVGRIISEVAQGAGQQVLQTGTVTPEGIAGNIPAAIGGTLFRKTISKYSKRGTAVADGGETINAAERPEGTTSPPPQPAQEPVPAPQEQVPEPPPPPSPVPQPVAIPETLAAVPATPPPSPPAPPAPEPVAPTTPRKTTSERRAKIALEKDDPEAAQKKEASDRTLENREKSDAKSRIQQAMADSKRIHQADPELAMQLLDRRLEDYKKVYGEDAQSMLDAEKKLRQTESAKKSAPTAPKTESEAVSQVQDAVNQGTEEAIDKARPAIEVLHPVGTDADAVTAKLKEDAKAPKLAPEPIAEPPASEPSSISPQSEPSTTNAPAPKSSDGIQKAANNVRVNFTGEKGKEVDLPSAHAWASDPIASASDAVDFMDHPKAVLIVSRESPAAAKDMTKAIADIKARIDAPLADGTVRSVVDDAYALLPGIDIGQAVIDPTSAVLDDFLAEKGITKEEFKKAYQDSHPSVQEQAALARAIGILAQDHSDIGGELAIAQALSQVELHAFPLPSWEKITADTKAMLETSIEMYDHYFERAADHMVRMEHFARVVGGEEAGNAAEFLNKTVRRMQSEIDLVKGRQQTKISNELRALSFKDASAENMILMTDFLEGRRPESEVPKNLRHLYEAMKRARDEITQNYQAGTGREGLKSWMPRVELPGVVNAAVREIEKAVPEADLNALKKYGATTETSKRIEAPPPGSLSGEAVSHYTEALKKAFKLRPDGKIELVDGEHVPQYLFQIDDEGEMNPHLPQILRKTSRPGSVQVGSRVIPTKEFTVDVTPVDKQTKVWTQDELDRVLQAEAVRAICSREDYDPMSRNPNAFMRRNGAWQQDASLRFERLMPYMGPSFYERNAVNLLKRVSDRQTSALARNKYFGPNKSVILDNLVKMTGVFSDEDLGLAKNADGSYRLADKMDGAMGPNDDFGSLYRHSLLRSINEAAMGYISTGGKDQTGLSKATRKISSVMRVRLLAMQMSAVINQEIDLLQQAGLYGPEAVAQYFAQRMNVSKMGMSSSARTVGAKVAASLGAKDLARRWVMGDPMNAAQMMRMAEHSMVMGIDGAERRIAGLENVFSTFAQASAQTEIASHLMAHNLFLSAVQRRIEDPVKFSKERGLVPEKIQYTTTKEALDEAETLLDSQGEPRDVEANKRLMELSRPFADEFKSGTTGTSNALFSTKLMRQQWAKDVGFMQTIPLAIASANVSDIRRQMWRVKEAPTAAQQRMEIARLTKRAGSMVGAAVASGYARKLAKANLGAAAVLGTIGVGGWAALAANSLMGHGYHPDTRKAESEMTEINGQFKDGNIPPVLGKLFAVGVPWYPRILDPDMMTDAEAKLAKVPNPVKQGLDVASTVAPSIVAMGQEASRAADALSMIPMLVRQKRYGQAGRLGFAAATGTGLRAMGREITGIRESKKVDPGEITKKIKEETDLLKSKTGRDLLVQGVDNQVSKLNAFGHQMQNAPPPSTGKQWVKTLFEGP